MSTASPATTDAHGTEVSDAVSVPDSSTLAPGLRLLPEPVRTDVYRLYHVLRSLDDLVDEDRDDARERLEAVERWTHGEEIVTPETAVLSDLSSRRGLSPQPVAAFCLAMRHDTERAEIENEDDLERYCQQAGGAVGVMLAQMIGTRRADGAARMASLGRAVQRTNILRDIDDDLDQGRVYIARSTIERFGPPLPGRRERLLRDQIAKADALYDEALSATPILIEGQDGLALSAALYREILRQIEREGYGRAPRCVVVPEWRRRAIITEHDLVSH
jgi:15-cis-phytoene synthase